MNVEQGAEARNKNKQEADLAERRRELLAHYHRCREQYPINRDHEVIE